MKYTKLILPLGLLALVILSYWAIFNFIKINSINCTNQFGPCSPYLTDRISSFKGRSLGNFKKEVTRLLKKEIVVSDFSIQYKVPDKAYIYLIEKKPKFALKDTGHGVFALISKDGTILRIQDSTNLPYIETGYKNPNVGEKVSGEEFFALNLIYYLYSLYQVDKGRISDDSMVIELPEGQTVIFPLQGDEKTLLGSLSLIYLRLKGTDKDSKISNVLGIRTIDLRFKNPVLK